MKRKTEKSLDPSAARIVAYLDSVQARLASLRELQSAAGEELRLRTLLLSVPVLNPPAPVERSARPARPGEAGRAGGSAARAGGPGSKGWIGRLDESQKGFFREKVRRVLWQ